jgi:hypothetical protein
MLLLAEYSRRAKKSNKKASKNIFFADSTKAAGTKYTAEIIRRIETARKLRRL